MMTDMRDKIVSTLRKPPEASPAHKDRFAWDQAELVADEIMELVQAHIDKLTTELKPCPFCGGKGIYFPDHTSGNCDSIYCELCDATVNDFNLTGPQGSCRELWNTRATPSAEVIRGMIKPLVWPIDPHHTGIYKTKWQAGVYYTMKIRSPNMVSWRVNYHEGWFCADSEAAAQAAANEHNANTILAALGLTE